jgi:hypothetical protein
MRQENGPRLLRDPLERSAIGGQSSSGSIETSGAVGLPTSEVLERARVALQVAAASDGVTPEARLSLSDEDRDALHATLAWRQQELVRLRHERRAPDGWLDGVRELIYLASPISTYPTYRYDLALCRIEARFPAADVIPARRERRDSADWLARWPATVRTLDRLVYFPAADRTIGAGVAREVIDAYALRLPVHLLDGQRLRDHSVVTWRWLAPGERARVALVLPELRRR